MGETAKDWAISVEKRESKGRGFQLQFDLFIFRSPGLNRQFYANFMGVGVSGSLTPGEKATSVVVDEAEDLYRDHMSSAAKPRRFWPLNCLREFGPRELFMAWGTFATRTAGLAAMSFLSKTADTVQSFNASKDDKMLFTTKGGGIPTTEYNLQIGASIVRGVWMPTKKPKQ